MTYAELAALQAKRSKTFSEAQVEAMATYCQAEHDLKEMQAENAKLRELVRGLEVCADEDADARTDCPLYDEGEPDRCAKERIKRELGIEVDA